MEGVRYEVGSEQPREVTRVLEILLLIMKEIS